MCTERERMCATWCTAAFWEKVQYRTLKYVPFTACSRGVAGGGGGGGGGGGLRGLEHPPLSSAIVGGAIQHNIYALSS